MSDWSSDVCSSDLLGIEFVFYAIFPLLLALFRTSWRSATLCCAVFLVCQLAFVNMVLATGTLTQSWERYIQYGSFGFYFAFGMLLGKYLEEKSPTQGSRTALGIFMERSEESRVGKEGVSRGSSRGSPCL